MARRMPQFKDEEIGSIVKTMYVVDEFDEEAVARYQEMLCQPERVNIYLTSKKFQGKTERESAWY